MSRFSKPGVESEAPAFNTSITRGHPNPAGPNAALPLSHLPVPKAKRIDGSAAHPILRGFPANETPQCLKQSCNKNRNILQITADFAAVKLNSLYGVYEAVRSQMRPPYHPMAQLRYAMREF